MQIDDLRFCYAFDKTNPAQCAYVEGQALPRLKSHARALRAIQQANDPLSTIHAEYGEQIEEIERAIEEAKTRLREAAGHEQTELF